MLLTYLIFMYKKGKSSRIKTSFLFGYLKNGAAFSERRNEVQLIVETHTHTWEFVSDLWILASKSVG